MNISSHVGRLLGEREHQVLNILWSRGGQGTVRDVVNELRPEGIAYTTVMTIMSRLVDKGLLERRDHRQPHLYRTRRSRKQLYRSVAGQILKRIRVEFGDVAIACFVEEAEKVSRKKFKRLMRAMNRPEGKAAFGMLAIGPTSCTTSPWLLIGLLTSVIAAIALGSFFCQWMATRRFLKSLTLTSVDAEVVRIASDRPLCFCAGFLRPRIYVSDGTRQTLTAEELSSVFAHERHHLRRLDPLRSALLKALVHGFFFLPVLRTLEKRYAIKKEVAADAEAVRQAAGKVALASAMYKLSMAPVTGSSLSFFAYQSSLEIRLLFLSGSHHLPLPWTFKTVSISLLSLLAVFLLTTPSSLAQTPPVCNGTPSVERAEESGMDTSLINPYLIP